MITEIQMEKRNCASCGRSFKAMTKSPSVYCNELCVERGRKIASGIAAHGEPLRALSEKEKRTETIRVELTPLGPKEPGNAFDAVVGAWPKRNATEKDRKTTITKTKNSAMKGENKMQNERVSEATNGTYEGIGD